MKNCIQHVDFFEVTFGQLLRTKVRVELTGTPVGVRDGGVLEQVVHEVEIECFPRHLPESIVADISSLGLNEAFRVKDLVVADVIKLLDDPDMAIASVKMVKEDAPVEATAAAADAATDASTPTA